MTEVIRIRDSCHGGESLAIEPAGLLSSLPAAYQYSGVRDEEPS